MTTRIPNVPVADVATTEFLTAVNEVIELREGQRADVNAGFVTKGELIGVWQAPVLLDNWVRYSETQESPAFLKDATGTVRIKGTVASGTPGATARVFMLPVGMRPAYKLVFAVITNTGLGQVDIESTGEVRPISGGATWFSLNGISFTL